MSRPGWTIVVATLLVASALFDLTSGCRVKSPKSDRMPAPIDANETFDHFIENTEETTTTGKYDLADEFAEESVGRLSVGGDSVSPLPYITLLWKPKLSVENTQYDGLLAGLGIRIKNHYMIAHQESHLLGGPLNERSRDPTQYKPTQTIDVTKGRISKDPHQPAGSQADHLPAYSHDRKKLLGNGMAVFKLNYFDEVHNTDIEELDDDQLPKLQSDKSVANNCFIYSYSAPFDSKSVEPLLVPPGNKRTFSRWPVKLIPNVGCQSSDGGAICEFMDGLDGGSPGAVCLTYGDVGAPILCGSKQKLSYVATKQDSGDDPCFQTFKAFRIADHHDTLKNIDRKTRKRE